MKIIQPGQINEVPPDWWHGKRLTCSSCRAVFELEDGDPVTAHAERRVGGTRTVAAKCPTCETTVTHHEGDTFQTITWNSESVIQPTHIEPSWPVPNPLPLTIMSTATGSL